jgi:hypothetical protein
MDRTDIRNFLVYDIIFSGVVYYLIKKLQANNLVAIVGSGIATHVLKSTMKKISYS